MKEELIEYLTWDDDYPISKKSIEMIVDRLLSKYELKVK